MRTDRQPALTDTDHESLTVFLGHALDAYRESSVGKARVVQDLAQLIAAIDSGKVDEARDVFRQGRKWIVR